MGLLDPNSNIPNASGVWGWNGTERLQPGAKYTSAGGEETKAPAGPEAFSMNERGEFYDPTFKRWMPSQGQNAWNMDFRKQVAANLANGNSAVWSSQTGWDQRSPIPSAWGSQPSAPPVPTGANPAWGPMMADPDHAFTGMAPQQGQPSAIPSSQGMAPSAQQQMPYQWNTPQTTKQAAFNPMMNNFFSRYWGK